MRFARSWDERSRGAPKSFGGYAGLDYFCVRWKNFLRAILALVSICLFIVGVVGPNNTFCATTISGSGVAALLSVSDPTAEIQGIVGRVRIKTHRKLRLRIIVASRHSGIIGGPDLEKMVLTRTEKR